MVKQDKFYNYVGLGHLDSENKQTLVYDPKTHALFVASTDVKFSLSSVVYMGGLTTFLYLLLRQIEVEGVSNLILGWLIAIIIGTVLARIVQSIPIRLESFQKDTMDFNYFLIDQLKLVNKLKRVIWVLTGIAICFALFYLANGGLVFIVSSSILVATVLLIYRIGISKRSAILKQLLRDEGEI